MRLEITDTPREEDEAFVILYKVLGDKSLNPDTDPMVTGEHDPTWPDQFLDLASRVTAVLGPRRLRVEVKRGPISSEQLEKFGITPEAIAGRVAHGDPSQEVSC
jgi:hypothetical protein